jgi:alpha-L-fucosidase
MRNKAIYFIILFAFLKLNTYSQKTYQPTWESIDSRPLPSWFEDAKFGIFIHWGVYSVPAYSPTVRDSVIVWDRYAEWYWKRWKDKNAVQKYFQEFHNRMFGKDKTYYDFANDFKAEMFNPDDWAQRFKDAGAKYVVLTTKHHDGFALWPTKYSWNWNAMEIGAQRDLVGALAKSVREKGVRMGCYYSLKEWYNPLCTKENINEYVDTHMIPQMKELVNSYKPDVLWTDGDGDFDSKTLKSTEFLTWLYNESPVKDKVVVNDRWGTDTGGKHGGFYTTEYDNLANAEILNNKSTRPWEECRGIAGSFGYNRNENLEDYSTSEELVHILINKVARGGNLLLNVGPTADGRIPEIQQQRLADIGAWLKVNGEAIYSTRKWDNAPTVTPKSTVYFTKKGADIYVIVTKWQEKPIVVENVRNTKSVTMLGFLGKVKYSVSGGKLTINPPSISPATNPCNYAWVYKINQLN